MFTALEWTIVGLALGLLVILFFFLRWVFSLRRVVAPNEVHIVRKGRRTLIYGNVEQDFVNQSSGNAYYEWPVWIPILGVSVSKLPLSVFDMYLENYAGYDKDRVPFVVDIQAFFRIADYKLAASRISDFQELTEQLKGVLQGASRSMLANEYLETIMGERTQYGAKFTDSVKDQLANWGVYPVKNIELMDIRDAAGEAVIDNIMRKKKSEIEKDSRITVAQNDQAAREAEIAAQQSVDIKEQQALETVGKKKAEVSANVGIEQEKASQKIKEEARTTKEKEMAVIEVEKTRDAEITQKAKVIEAETAKKEREIAANAEKAQTVIKSEGERTAAENNALAIKSVGEAKADAEKKMQMASVEAQTALAKEIGGNEGYQRYLVETRQIEANEKVGLEQAKNINGADIKIIAGAGSVTEGIGKAADVMSPKGGFALGSMLESLSSTPEGKTMVDAITAFLNTQKAK